MAAAVTAAVAAVVHAPADQSAAERAVDYAPSTAERPEVVTLDDGRRALVDAVGTRIPLVHYERIVSASLVADRVLLDLAEPDRLIAASHYADANAEQARRLGDRPRVAPFGPVEALLALKPDLVIINTHVHVSKVQRLRDAGLNVCDLGPMRGLATLDGDVRAMALLLGDPNRGERYLQRLHWRLAALRRTAPDPRPRGMYLALYGKKVIGGTRGTSFHDVLEAAGLDDAAAATHEGWPAYRRVDLLQLDPDVFVTPEGHGKRLCESPGLGKLGACRRNDEGQRSAILEGPEAVLGDPGPGILEAAELVRDRLQRRR